MDSNSNDVILVIRTIEYLGTKEWIDVTMARREVKGIWQCKAGRITETYTRSVRLCKQILNDQ